MKIGFISPHTFTYPGGVQKHTLSLKKSLKKRTYCKNYLSPGKLHQKRGKDEILLAGLW